MNRTKPSFDQVLAECVEAVLTGEESIKSCVQRYPEHADELAELLPLAKSLRKGSDVKPSLSFRLRSKDRLLAKLPDRSPGPVTFWERIRTSLMKPQPRTIHRRTAMTWLLIGSLVVAMLGGGGVGVAYAADGASPGQPLYTVDRALESAQMGLTFNDGSRAELALAFAQERVTEAETLAAEGASADAIGQAAAGYQANIQEAAQALAAVAASGDEAHAQALQNLLDAALSVHETTLSEVANQVPEEAAPAIQGAIQASQAGRQAVEDVVPGDGPPEGAGAPEDIGPPEDAGPPEDTGRPEDAGPPEGVPGEGDQADESAAPQNAEARISDLDQHIASAQAHAENGDYEAARVELEEYENEVDTLAQELADMATEEEGRAEALAALLDEALSRHTEVLTQLADQVPAEAQGFIQDAINSSAAGQEAVRGLFAEGMPGGAPSDSPGSGYDPGQ